MKLILNLAMDNEAFSDRPGAEAARILRELAERLERELTDPQAIGRMNLRDINGNTCGAAFISDCD